MAAGRIDFTWRRGFYESYNNRNGTRGGGSDRGAVYCRNGHRDSSAFSNVDIRRSGSSCREEERGYEIQKEHGDGFQLPLEKKRKFSPIIWDLVEKKARASSVNQDASLSKGFVAQESVNNDGSESSVILSPSSPRDEQWGDDIEEGQVEEEALVEARNLSLSRWASDGDAATIATLFHDENTPRETGYRKTVSPENEELQKDDSCGDRSNSSVFDGDSSVGSDSRNDNGNIFEGGDLIDVDEVEDAEVSDLIEEPASTHGSVNMLQESRSVYEFEYLHEINEGTYGKVYKARDKKTGEEVALKKVKMDVGKDIADDYGFPLSALREINILLSLRHPSIVNIKEVVTGDLDSVFMVMEHMDHDLKGLMQAMKQPFSTSEVKCLMLQLLEGVKCLHDNWVLHRDLKTSNLLYKDGRLKICDFGMSRQYGSPLKPYTSLVVTLWYRAPELLLGAKQYSTAVDMWSVGCIMAELLGKEPLFQGKREIEQLQKIFETLGTPNEKIWPGLSKLLEGKVKFAKHPYNLLRKKFPAASFTGSPVLSDLGFDLLNKLLTYDPEKRITADDALHHAWFHEVPLPKSIAMMPTFPPTFPQFGKKRHVQGIMKSPNPRSRGGRQCQVLSDTSESVA